MFIVLEGTDGCGKQTQCQLLSNKILECGYKVRNISFPNYNHPGSIFVKSYLNGELGEDASHVNPYTASLCYTMDRVASLSSWVSDVLSDDVIVIADRYIGSNAIYQGSKFPDNQSKFKYFDWLYDLEIKKLGLPKPDMTVFLDMPVEVSLALMKDRPLKAGTEKDIHEENVRFLEDSYYTGLLAADYYKWAVVKCVNKNNEVIEREILSQEIFTVVKEVVER